MPRPSTRDWLSWAWLVLALAWVVLTRVPLVLNAEAHLDSDLAVDGLTLLDATQGHWRWHYPGTPHIGIAPVLLAWPLAMVAGAGPRTLVASGVAAYLAVVIATFWLNRRAFGVAVASWGLVPLAFASTGTIWLSGRVTGGHLLATAWYAGALALLYQAVSKGGWVRSAALGLWCGLGFAVDSMFGVAIVGVAVGGTVGWLASGRSRRGWLGVVAFLAATALGLAPRVVGSWVDPHDSYREQFDPLWNGDVLLGHARTLGLDCLPRLVAGHRLPGLEAEPAAPAVGGSKTIPWRALGVTTLTLGLFLGAIVAWLIVQPGPADPARLGVRWGMAAASLVVVAGFIINRNIFNSDNYRYLVFLLVPWSSGFGLLMTRLARRGAGVAWVLTLGFATLMTVDAFRWYERFGWVDASGRPTLARVDDPALTWLASHPEATAILADYWDAYRLAYRTGGRVRGVPFPEYPDRFPEVAATLPGRRPSTLVVRGLRGGGSRLGVAYRARALASGGHEVFRADDVAILDWPVEAAR